MNSSLEKLVSYMNKNDFKIMNKFYVNKTKRNLLLRKEVLPYDYLKSFECMEEIKLPPKDAFFSKLKNEDISNEDYAHAQNVWNIFNLETFGDYVELYLETDVLLLADIFENFRNVSLNAYKLDPAHYFTTPGKTKIKILCVKDV